MASINSRSSNNQAGKVLLSQLYVSWASDTSGIKRIQDAILEVLEEARINLVSSSLSPNANIGVNNSSSNGNRNDHWLNTHFSNHTPAAGVASFSSTPLSRHVDPASGTEERARSVSPPATPPSRLSHVSRWTDDCATSPTTSPSAGSRFLGVDELDYSNRVGTPSGVAGSQHTKPVVDPNAPLPQQHCNLVSSLAAHSHVGPAVGTSLNVAMVDIAPVGDVSIAKESTAARFVHSAGRYAVAPPNNLRRATLEDIPVFYTHTESRGVLERIPQTEQKKLSALLEEEGGKPIRKALFGDISVYVFQVPLWYKDALFAANCEFVDVPKTSESLTPAQVERFYSEKFGTLSPSRRLYELIRGGENRSVDYITLEDLKEMVKYLVEAHPALDFLQQPEFQEYYCRTVAIRIMYALERQQCRRIYWRDFDRSDLPEVMMELDNKDVNQVLQYFSYEHFYVLYCKFWELDTDRDLLIDFNDLCGYGQGSIVPSVIRRVVDGYGRQLTSTKPKHLDFEDFVYFCLSEEDKNSEPAVYYWFKILDLDNDGFLSGHEIFQFYKENQQRFLEYPDSPDGDNIIYEDAMCQMLDMLGFDRIKTRRYGVTLGDLRACPTPSNFFNMIFNGPKFMLFEHRDPFSEHQQKLCIEKTDWDRFARAEYDHMAAEAQ